MKTLLNLVLALFLSNFISAQSCIDETLINLDVLCTQEYDPVCGCNGVTYSNSCNAINTYGVTCFVPGECGDVPTPQSVGSEFFINFDQSFGTDDIPQSALTCIYSFVANEPFWPEENYAWTFGNGQTAESPTPSSISFAAIENGEAVSSPYEVCLTLTNEAGTCSSTTCQDLDPCDIVDQNAGGNCNPNLSEVDFGECEMALGIGWNGTSCSYFSGCSATGSDGVDYSNYFFEDFDSCYETCGEPGCLSLADVDFGECELLLGWGWIGDSCVPISGCSTVGADGFDYANFIYPNAQMCETNCACINPQIIGTIDCGVVFNPVCSCDNITHFSACTGSNLTGMQWYTDGPCENPQSCINEDVILPNYDCGEYYQPVCGCNDVDYDNPCFALIAGVQSWTMGTCTNSIGKIEKDGFTIFPNPATDYFTLPNLGSTAQLRLYNMLGKVMISQQLAGGNQQIDVSKLPVGIYIYHIETPQKVYSGKLIKE